MIQVMVCLVQIVIPFNEVSIQEKGDFTKRAELTREQAISSDSELKFSSGIDATEANGT